MCCVFQFQIGCSNLADVMQHDTSGLSSLPDVTPARRNHVSAHMAILPPTELYYLILYIFYFHHISAHMAILPAIRPPSETKNNNILIMANSYRKALHIYIIFSILKCVCVSDMFWLCSGVSSLVPPVLNYCLI